MKIVINTCYGGISISERAMARLAELQGSPCLTPYPEDRANPLLVQVVEELGELASGALAELKIVDIPDGIDWEIEEYDGKEWVAERHQTWG